MTPTTLAERALAEAIGEAWSEQTPDTGPWFDDAYQPWPHWMAPQILAALLALPPERRAAIAAELLDVDVLAPHPNEQHEFRTTCLRCGERGMLHISLIGPDEVVTIAPLRSPQ